MIKGINLDSKQIMSQFEIELKFGTKIIRKATSITEWFRKKAIESFSFKKQDESPVTLADFASQIYLIIQLREYFQDDQIIAEEENLEFIDKPAENLIKQCF